MNEQKHEILGCDIGNGYAYASILRTFDEDPVPLFPPEYNLDTAGMPSSVFVQSDGRPCPVFGSDLQEEMIRHPERLIHAVKDRLTAYTAEIDGIDAPVSLDDGYSAIAEKLLTLANEYRTQMGEAPVTDVVFTFPAIYEKETAILNRMQKDIESVVIGGKHVRVLGRLPEPAAAAIDWQHHRARSGRKDDWTVVIFDLGYGTFDTAAVSAGDGNEPYRLIAKDGLADVGGKQFDAILQEIIFERLGAPQHSPRLDEHIRKEAVEIKHDLTKSVSTTRNLMGTGLDYVTVEVTRDEFERKSLGLLSRILENFSSFLESLVGNGIIPDSIVLTGGSSQMPMIWRNVEETVKSLGLDIPVDTPYRPSKAVSYGAARYAYGLMPAGNGTEAMPKEPGTGRKASSERKAEAPEKASNRVLEQYTERQYGLLVTEGDALQDTFVPLIGKGAKLPAVSKPYTLTSESARLQVKTAFTLNGSKDGRPCTGRTDYRYFNPGGRTAEITMTVTEGYDIRIRCVSGGREIEEEDLTGNMKRRK